MQNSKQISPIDLMMSREFSFSWLVFFFSLHLVSATWRQEHAVIGLPTIEGAEIKSFAGIAPVRKDEKLHVEVGSGNIRTYVHL